MADTSFDFELLADGRIKVITSAVSGPLHLQAEQFFKFLSEALGETISRERRADVSVVEHSHGVGAVHSHGGE
jgi:hypothetical protein